jgi:hypothetical protein
VATAVHPPGTPRDGERNGGDQSIEESSVEQVDLNSEERPPAPVSPIPYPLLDLIRPLLTLRHVEKVIVLRIDES